MDAPASMDIAHTEMVHGYPIPLAEVGPTRQGAESMKEVSE